jgi:hypothetical protein
VKAYPGFKSLPFRHNPKAFEKSNAFFIDCAFFLAFDSGPESPRLWVTAIEFVNFRTISNPRAFEKITLALRIHLCIIT